MAVTRAWGGNGPKASANSAKDSGAQCERTVEPKGAAFVERCSWTPRQRSDAVSQHIAIDWDREHPWLPSRFECCGVLMNENRPHTTTTAGFVGRISDAAVSKTRFWWLLVITGIAWIVLSVVILRYDYTTVAAVAVLFGGYCLAAAGTQSVIGAVSSSTGWRIAHGLLAALLIVAGVVSFANFGATFATLTAIISFYFIVRGCIDIVTAFAANVVSGWWVLLICGFIELGLGF